MKIITQTEADKAAFLLVNNTGCDLQNFEPIVQACIRTGDTLPDELADLFTLDVRTVNGQVRGFLNLA